VNDLVLEKLYRHVDDQFEEHLRKIRDYLRQPSISADGTGMVETAEITKGFIEEVGGHGEIVSTDGWPVVYGELFAGNDKKTLLIYGMYDVQPVDEDKWSVPPFEAKIVNMEPFGKCLVARGAINTKGPLRAFFNTLETILEVEGELPVNLIFVIEGEEELGSIHLPQFVNKYVDKLKRADAMYFPIPSQDRKGKVEMFLGVKGIIYMDLICRGGDWGGPTEFGIHSSNAAWIDSPVWRLLWALTSMKSPDGKILIEGFYDDIREPTPSEIEMIKKIVKTFDEETIKEQIKVKRFIDDLHGEELIKRYLYSPTLNIDGIVAGYIGPGTKTVLPHEVLAKIDIRLVPNMDTEDIIQKFKNHLKKHGFEDIEVRVHDCYPWAYTSIEEEIVQAWIRTYRKHGYEPEVWPWLGGSAPFYLFNREPLNLPFVDGGLGHGGRAHSPDEYFVVQGIKDFEKSVITFLYEYAGEK